MVRTIFFYKAGRRQMDFQQQKFDNLIKSKKI